VLRSSSNAFFYVTKNNMLLPIPDDETLATLISAMTPAAAQVAGVPDEDLPLYGPWSDADVSLFPQGPYLPALLDWQSVANTIVESGAASFIVDGSGVSHPIPSVADFICRNVADGVYVSRTGLPTSQIDSLVAGSTDACSIGPALVTESDGPASYFVSGGNNRSEVPDVPTYWFIDDTIPTHYTWQTATVTALPSLGTLSDPMVNKIIEGPSPNNNFYFIGTNLKKYWIPNSSVLSCLEGPGHNVPFFSRVEANVVDNFPNASNWAACS
jgi:hypothetical protein